MKRLKVNKHILHVLKNCNTCVRKSILKNANPELIRTLCEISLNLVNGNMKVSKNCRARLKKYKKKLRELASSKGKVSSKRKILVQHGGFLPLLLGSLLTGAIGKLIENF